MNQLFGEHDRLLREVSRYIYSQILEYNILQVTLEVTYQESPKLSLQTSIESEPQIDLELTDEFFELLISLNEHRDAPGVKWHGFQMEVTNEAEVEIDYLYD